MTAPNRGFGVQVTVAREGAAPVLQPLVVVARDALDAEIVASRIGGGVAEAQSLRELTPDEVAQYGLDLAVHGDARALPVLDL